MPSTSDEEIEGRYRLMRENNMVGVEITDEDEVIDLDDDSII